MSKKIHRLGAINPDTSHPKAFTEQLKNIKRAEYCCYFNDSFRTPEEVEELARLSNSVIVENLDDMVSMVDAVFIHGCNWDKHLHYSKPFTAKKIPVIIDKPVVGNVTDCIRLESMSEEGAVFLGGSAMRYSAEINDFLAMKPTERGEILNITSSIGVDEFNYAIHAIEAILALLPVTDVATGVKYIGATDTRHGFCESYFIRFQSGITATVNCSHGAWQPSIVTVLTDRQTHCMNLDIPKAYNNFLSAICDYLDDGSCAYTGKELTKSVRILLAGKSSKLQNGEEINPSQLKDDSIGFDGYAFEKEYMKANKK